MTAMDAPPAAPPIASARPDVGMVFETLLASDDVAPKENDE